MFKIIKRVASAIQYRRLQNKVLNAKKFFSINDYDLIIEMFRDEKYGTHMLQKLNVTPSWKNWQQYEQDKFAEAKQAFLSRRFLSA